MELTLFDSTNVPALMCVHLLSLRLPLSTKTPPYVVLLRCKKMKTDILQQRHAEQ